MLDKTRVCGCDHHLRNSPASEANSSKVKKIGLTTIYAAQWLILCTGATLWS
jgi:hypothetical protein